MLPTRESLQGKRHTDWEWGDGKKIFYANRNDKKVGVAIIISNKIDFKTKAIMKDKKRALHNDKGINTKRGYYTC